MGSRTYPGHQCKSPPQLDSSASPVTLIPDRDGAAGQRVLSAWRGSASVLRIGRLSWAPRRYRLLPALGVPTSAWLQARFDVCTHSARARNPRKLWLRIRLACRNIETPPRKRAKTTRIRRLIKNVDAHNKKGGRSRPKSPKRPQAGHNIAKLPELVRGPQH
jgi:hypothetical protein